MRTEILCHARVSLRDEDVDFDVELELERLELSRAPAAPATKLLGDVSPTPAALDPTANAQLHSYVLVVARTCNDDASPISPVLLAA